MFWRPPHLGVLPREEALFEAAVHGERDEGHQPPVLQQSERGQEGVAERLPVPTKLTGLLLVNVVQKHPHNEHGQHTHACHTTKGRQHWLLQIRELLWSESVFTSALLTEGVLKNNLRYFNNQNFTTRFTVKVRGNI